MTTQQTKAMNELTTKASAQLGFKVAPVTKSVRTHTGISQKNKAAIKLMAARTNVPQATLIDSLLTKALATTTKRKK